MHWISLIGFFIIVSICQAQPSIYKSFETGNTNKGGTFQTVPGGQNAVASMPKTDGDGSTHVNTNNAPSGSSKDGQNRVRLMSNTGNNNYCYIVLPFVIAALMTIVHF
jgi:hypothetical protein